MATEEMDCEDFLEIVWGEKEGWVDLPAKVNSYWVPFHAEWPADGVVSRRIDSSLRDREDLYYSVALFSERGRAYENVLPTSWLWADLDEVHPTEAARSGYLPTLAIQSSPGRHQALWKLTRELPPKSVEKLNRALSYALGADRGGWDLTQVLRIPGTRNFKYPEAPLVELLWYRPDVTYEPRDLWAKLKHEIPRAELLAATDVVIPKTGIPARAKALLRATDVVQGERSSKLWELNCLLAESGLKEEEIYGLVVGTRWNKWAGIRSGGERLRRDIRKAIRHVSRRAAHAAATETDTRERTAERGTAASSTERESERGSGDDDVEAQVQVPHLPWVGYASFMAMVMEDPKWLVKDIWTAASQGIIGGEPKTSKTSLALALALSVASGKPFLGKFPVGTSGPVLFIQEENAPWMVQDRLRKLAVSYGLISKRDVQTRPARRGDLARKGSVITGLEFPTDFPLEVLNNYGFDLGEDDHREALWAKCEELGPKMVIIDPLYLVMGDANTDQLSDIKPYLKWMLALRMEFDCAVILVHHMRKKNMVSGAVRPGQNLMGSAILHGWVDCALYASAQEIDKEGWISCLIEREFRSMAPQKPIELDMTFGQPGDLTFESSVRHFDLMSLIAKRVREAGEITVAQLAEVLSMDKRTLLARVRGSEIEGVRMEVGSRGTGKSPRLVWCG